MNLFQHAFYASGMMLSQLTVTSLRLLELSGLRLAAGL
jgi:hypothetical protein